MPLPQANLIRHRTREASIKGIVIAGTHSGCGKTTVSLGLMAELVRRGLRVAPFKVGPDFIDPGHHARVTGRTSRNLDGWMLSADYNRNTFQTYAAAADIAVVEGVMGLFDGYDGKSEAGSTAQMAKWLGLPVVLVVDARSMARSAAALVQGFERFDPDLRFAGVIFNNLGSARHRDYLREALPGAVRMPGLGGLLRDDGIRIPERHLGLVTREDHPPDTDALSSLAEMVAAGIDVASLLSALPDATLAAVRAVSAGLRQPGRIRIGVARDNAFCFYYPDNLDMLADRGAETVFFSPMRDERLPADLDGLYFGGGYPELFAQQLSARKQLLAQIRRQSAAGMPVYAECGGFMYLCAALEDHHGKRFPMAGCFPFTTRMLPRLKALGYREVRLSRDTIIGPQGLVIRGHEFHYSEMAAGPEPAETAYRIAGRDGPQRPPEGYVSRRTLGSYIHLHFGSAPAAAEAFVANCRAYRAEREQAL